MRKKETAMKNIVRRNDVFDTQHFQESLKISKKYKNYGTSDRVKKEIGQKSPKPLRTKYIISEVKMMNHLIELSRLQEIPRNATEIQSNRTQKDV